MSELVILQNTLALSRRFMSSEHVCLDLSYGVICRQFGGELLFRDVGVVEVNGLEELSLAYDGHVRLGEHVRLFVITGRVLLNFRRCVGDDDRHIIHPDIQVLVALTSLGRLRRVLC